MIKRCTQPLLLIQIIGIGFMLRFFLKNHVEFFCPFDNIRRIRNNNPADAAIRFRLLNHKNVKRRLCFFIR